ncbi:MAG: ABC transporter substrate-binding protein [Actinomycetota bacterium]
MEKGQVAAMVATPHTARRSTRRPAIALVITAGLIAGACASDDDDSDDVAATVPAPADDADSDDADGGEEDAGSDDPDGGEADAPVETPTANLTDGCVESVVEGVDYFPEKVELEYASNFSVSYHDTYKILTIDEPFPAGEAESYVLVQCGADAPAEVDAPAPVAATIDVPIGGLLSSSTTHLPFIEQLDRIDDLVGVSSLGFVSSQAVLDRSGDLIEYASEGALDTEVALTAGADALMTGGTDDEGHQVLRDAGLPVVANAEWLEPTPLGRAEWIKYMSVLFNEEAAATAQFESVEADYDAVVALAAGVADGERPSVMTGVDFDGTYFAAGGDSYVASLIADAGGAYVWSDNTETGSLSIDLEAQLERGGDAEIWINGSTFWTSLDGMVEEEPRYGEFAAQQSGQVWVYNRIQNENGGVDYFERGVTRPDLVLADLLKIFHPELAEDHAFEWYQQVPA